VSCASLHHYAARRLGDALASSGTGFAGDDDPELISAAAPFSLKLMESVLQEDPQHTALLTAAAASFTEFAYAFVQEEADEIEAHDVEGAFARRQRAWGLYRRAREYGLRALDTRHAHFVDGLHRDPAVAAAQLDLADRAAVYWTMVAAAAAISVNKDSAESLADLPIVEALAERLTALDPDFDYGALDSFLISYEMGRPDRRNVDSEAQRHLERAVRLSEGHRAAPYVAFAESVCVRTQNRDEFMAELGRALAVNPAERPQWRLENLLMQRRAHWLLAQVDELFLQERSSPP